MSCGRSHILKNKPIISLSIADFLNVNEMALSSAAGNIRLMNKFGQLQGKQNYTRNN
jgi:hypothetical protein